MTATNPENKNENITDKPNEQHDHHNHEGVHIHGPHCNHGHHHELLKPIVRTAPKIGRNDPCLCGSQKKYKKCCGN